MSVLLFRRLGYLGGGTSTTPKPYNPISDNKTTKSTLDTIKDILKQGILVNSMQQAKEVAQILIRGWYTISDGSGEVFDLDTGMSNDNNNSLNLFEAKYGAKTQRNTFFLDKAGDLRFSRMHYFGKEYGKGKTPRYSLSDLKATLR